MRTLLTGGAGFIGSALARRLVSDGHDVTVYDDFSTGRRDRLDGIPCRVVRGDIRDAETLKAAAQGCDSIVHLAYIQGTRNFYTRPSEVLSIALEGMQAVLGTGVREIILVSSAEAHQSASLPTPESVPLTVPDVLNPRFSYGGGKIACELMTVAAYHDQLIGRAVIIRPHNVIGPDMSDDHVVPDLCRKMNRLVKGNPAAVALPVQGTGAETRCYTWIGDAVDQFTLIMGKAPPLSVCHVGSQDERTVRDLAAEIGRCYGVHVTVIPSALAEGSPPRRQPALGFLDSLGYKPETSFGETIARTVAWYRDRG